ncbi:unnamed protein product [Calicophoron daubneyi]|uniref:Uncharacterized protein n=1 Tax=Calicophoron daubneyi TaxID=300641 RepID=A0AAV2TCU3_CALDB
MTTEEGERASSNIAPVRIDTKLHCTANDQTPFKRPLKNHLLLLFDVQCTCAADEMSQKQRSGGLASFRVAKSRFHSRNQKPTSSLQTSQRFPDQPYLEKLLDIIYAYGYQDGVGSFPAIEKAFADLEIGSTDLIGDTFGCHPQSAVNEKLLVKPSGSTRNGCVQEGWEQALQSHKPKGGLRKIIMYDCSNLVTNKLAFFNKCRLYLHRSQGVLLIINRVPFTPPSTLSQSSLYELNENIKEIIESLLESGFDVDWDVTQIPVITSRTKWVEMLKCSCQNESSPSNQGSTENTTLMLRRMISGPLKYTPWDENGQLKLNEQLIVVIAHPRIPPESSTVTVRRCIHPYGVRFGSEHSHKVESHQISLAVNPEIQKLLIANLPRIMKNSLGV